MKYYYCDAQKFELEQREAAGKKYYYLKQLNLKKKRIRQIFYNNVEMTVQYLQILFKGALFLDGGLDVVDRIFAHTLFNDDENCLKAWMDLPLHPLQEDEPGGDRHWIESSPALQVS